MSDGISLEQSARRDRRLKRIGRATEGGLPEAIERAGGELKGLSVKYGEWECLVTLRAKLPAGRMVAFVGAETFGGAMLKATREAESDTLKWREDKFARG